MQTPAERHRLFFALLPDERVLGEILRAADALQRSHGPRGKWVPPERLHLTLAFLGDFPALNTDVVQQALAAGDKVSLPGFDLALDSASSFHGRRPPWVLRCDPSRETLRPFWLALGSALEAAGFRTAPEPDFVPHVTVLRDADKPLEPVGIEPIFWPVREFALMHSRMGQVREYVVLRRWALGGGRMPVREPTLEAEVSERFSTHQVENQPPPLLPYDAYATDLPMREALSREGGGWAQAQVQAYGLLAGGEMMALGALANENKPKFKPVDPYGHRLDEVEFHPSYHRLMELGVSHGVTGFAWRHADVPGAHVARAALMYLHHQAEQGTSCPLTMTYACVPAIRHAPALAREWLPRIIAAEYDGSHRPAWLKAGNTIGMGMTEKQGGSDVRSNTTRATPIGDGLYELVGHKWFLSAPMCDAFLVLAQSQAGLSCFLLPRFAPDGTRNAIRIQRLKDKLGDWSNASSEVEFLGARAWLVGEEGRGVATILQMVALTRQDCLIGSAALMRQALVRAVHHARHRSAFGRALIEQPLMRNVLADLALESEAATALTFRVARAVDASARSDSEAALARVVTALGKYWVCKRCTPFVNEAQECLGGIGYVEDSSLPRLLRQAPLNSIWEGSGNIQCLDVLRALQREPACRDAYFAELQAARGGHALLDAEIVQLERVLAGDPAALEGQSRLLAERMALALQAAILIRAGDAAVAESFCQSRLGTQHGQAFGTLSASAPVAHLLGRAWPD